MCKVAQNGNIEWSTDIPFTWINTLTQLHSVSARLTHSHSADVHAAEPHSSCQMEPRPSPNVHNLQSKSITVTVSDPLTHVRMTMETRQQQRQVLSPVNNNFYEKWANTEILNHLIEKRDGAVFCKFKKCTGNTYKLRLMTLRIRGNVMGSGGSCAAIGPCNTPVLVPTLVQ